MDSSRATGHTAYFKYEWCKNHRRVCSVTHANLGNFSNEWKNLAFVISNAYSERQI